MAIDQRDVSSTLRFMDDRALQQYAAMHKSDPYIFPLAFQESQNRQKLRMSQQAQAGAMPQPKVADQALAQMAPQPMPETQGIGALPAQNMQGMADGGIAGYDDDANFAERSEPVVMMAGGGHVPRYQGNPQDGSVVRARGPYDQPPTSMTGEIPGFVAGTPIFQTQPSVDPEEPLFRRLLRERAETVEAQRTQEARARAAKGRPLSAEDQARIAKADTAKAAANTSAQDMAQFDAASNLYMTERAAKQAAAKPAPVVDNKAAPKVDTTRKTGPSKSTTPAAGAAAPAVDPFSMEALKAAQREAGGDYSGGELRNQAVEMRSKLEQQGEDRLTARKDEIAKEGDIYKGREERLTKREADIGKQKGENEGLALLNAGLAIMSTPGSLASAIGKGAQVGTAQYASGLKDLRAAQQKLEDARDNIEDLRLNRSDMNKREIRALEKERDANINDGNKLMFGVTKDLYNLDREDTRALVKTYAEGQFKQADIKSREKMSANEISAANARSAAQIAATLNTPDRLVFNQLLKDSGNDAVKAAEALQKMKAEKFNMYEAYSKYLTGFAGKENLMKGPDDFDVFAKRFIPTVTPSKNTTVRTQPGG